MYKKVEQNLKYDTFYTCTSRECSWLGLAILQQSEVFYGFCLVHLGVRVFSVLFWVISFLKDRFEKIAIWVLMFGKDVAYIHSLPRGISEGRGEASGTSCGIILVYRLPLISHTFTKLYLYMYTYRFHRLPIDMMKSFWENPRHFMFRVTRHFFKKKEEEELCQKTFNTLFHSISFSDLLFAEKKMLKDYYRTKYFVNMCHPTISKNADFFYHREVTQLYVNCFIYGLSSLSTCFVKITITGSLN